MREAVVLSDLAAPHLVALPDLAAPILVAPGASYHESLYFSLLLLPWIVAGYTSWILLIMVLSSTSIHVGLLILQEMALMTVAVH